MRPLASEFPRLVFTSTVARGCCRPCRSGQLHAGACGQGSARGGARCGAPPQPRAGKPRSGQLFSIAHPFCFFLQFRLPLGGMTIGVHAGWDVIEGACCRLCGSGAGRERVCSRRLLLTSRQPSTCPGAGAVWWQNACMSLVLDLHFVLTHLNLSTASNKHCRSSGCVSITPPIRENDVWNRWPSSRVSTWLIASTTRLAARQMHAPSPLYIIHLAGTSLPHKLSYRKSSILLAGFAYWGKKLANL